MEQLELATGAWVSWWNERRLHEACGYVPAAEFEEIYDRRLGTARTSREGLPTAIAPSGIDFVTTAPAPITHRLEISISPIKMHDAPSST